MAPPAAHATETDKTRLDLRGFERMYTCVDESSTKVAHVMLVAGPVRELLQHLPTALMHTFNLHPRMRALQVKGAFHQVEIQPVITVDDVASRRLLRVRATNAEEEASGVWKEHVKVECDKFVDRYQDFASFLEVWFDEARGMARLMLFSDHYMCDGFSGMVILNDTLESVALMANQVKLQPKQYPVRKSPYNLFLDPYTFSTPLSEMAVRMLSSVMKSKIMGFNTPLIPPRSDQVDMVFPFKNNPSYAMFESGSPETVKGVLARCKEEKVTYTGALTAAVILAYYQASQCHHSVALTEAFKIMLTMSTNLRLRLAEPVPEPVVGSYASLVPLESLETVGLEFATAKFWDVARSCKKEIDAGVKAPTVAFVDIFMDQQFNSATVPTGLKNHVLKNSNTGDVNISNIGRYPHKRIHTLGEAGDLSVEALFLYEAVPTLSAATLMFVSTVKSFNYSMMHKYEDEDAERLFKAYVAFGECIGGVGADDTMAEVLARVRPSLE